MDPKPADSRGVEIMRIVNRFMTPYAAILVVAGVFLGGAPKVTAITALAILIATATVNTASVFYALRNPEKLADVRSFRVAFNHTCNVWLIWLLLPYWKPIWTLFLLTMIAVGAYENKHATIANACLLSGLLMIITALRCQTTPLLWGETGVESIALLVAGLFVNSLKNAAPPA